MVRAYRESGDSLHPMIFLGPMLMFVFAFQPGLLVFQGELERFLSVDQIGFAQGVFTLGLFLFCVGVVCGGGRGRKRIRFEVSDAMRPKLAKLGVVLGILAIVSYWVGILVSGGFFTVYGRSKGFYSAGSGWINELVNLSIPATALMLLAWHGDRRYRHYILAAFLFASPLLLHGFLGARRGPTFIILATVLVAWYISSRKRVSIWKVVTRFGIMGVVILFLVANRQVIYLGSEEDLSVSRFTNRVLPSDVSSANDTVFMYGFVNGVSETQTHYWGKRFFVTYLVRPIPRQFWPTKYEDMGLEWMVSQRDFGGIEDGIWEDVLGWVPARGSAIGFSGDLFFEFSWVGLLFCMPLGYVFGWMWSQSCIRGGLWTLLYIELAALSIYIPTQSVSAVFHRYLVMSVPTIIIWRWYIGNKARPQVGQPVNMNWLTK